jgi:endonuclease YncB( thermonuclease family)
VLAAVFGLGALAGSIASPIGPSGSTEIRHEAAVESGRRAARAVLPGGHPADVLTVLDGDTFEARVHVWPGLAVTTKVRLRGIDTPELRARCAEERVKAEAAREALRRLLAEGQVDVRQVSVDKYGGRVVADASTRTTPSVAQALIKAGLAREYAGARRESWCG